MTKSNYVIILMGLPGAGKTTLARKLIEKKPHSYISRDEIRDAMFRPCLFTEDEKSAAFEGLCLALTVCLTQHRPCILDGLPFSKRYQIERIRAIASASKARLIVFHLLVSPEVAKARIIQDLRDGGSSIGDRTEAVVDAVNVRFESAPKDAISLDAQKDVHVLTLEALQHIPEN